MDYKSVPIDNEMMIALRHELHAHPELGWELGNTVRAVTRELDAAGVKYEVDAYGKNTVVATINPQSKGLTIGIRADMDALPIQEANADLPYRSQTPGIMHACGHDAHTAMLVGTAKALSAVADDLRCRVRLLFQPCEESRPSGAREMCAHGVMDDIDCIIMCHVNCTESLGVPSSRAGVTNATSSRFTVTLHGKSVHVAAPHRGVDALAMGVKVYQGIQMLVSREVNPFDTCVMSVCELHAGDTISTNADLCVLRGSIRCLKDETMLWAKARIERLVSAVCGEMCGTGEVDFGGDPLPCLINNEAMYRAFLASAEKVVGKGNVALLEPSPGGEDFAYYAQKKPGLLFGLSLRNEQTGCDKAAHTKDWRIDDAGLARGVQLFVQFVLDSQDGVNFPAG